MIQLSLSLVLLTPVLALALPQEREPVQPTLPVEDGLTQEQLEALTRDILADIEELRGAKYVREVKVSIADKAGFLDYANDRVDRMTTPDKVRAEELVLKVYGLLDPELDYMAAQMELLEGQVGGFYDPATESFCLMSSFQGGLAKIILAHELTHALDDQLYDIDGTLERLDGNADAQLAYQAVVEGSGTGLMNRWMLGNLGKGVSMKDLEGAGEMDTAGLADAPECMWKPMMMVYLRGASFLVRSDNVMVGQMGNIKNEDLHRAFTEPPRSSEQVLHPEKYWDPEQLDEPRVLTIDTSALTSAGWKLLHEDTLGESSFALVTSPMGERGGLDATNPMAVLGMRYTNRSAEGWGGDRYVLLEREGSLLYYMTSAWDTDKDADELHANLEKQAEYLGARRGALAAHLAGEQKPGSVQTHVLREGDRFAHAVLFNGAEGVEIEELVAALGVAEVLPPALPEQAWTGPVLETIEKSTVLKEGEEPVSMQIEIFQRGNGPDARKGDRVAVHYTGWVEGSELIFDSSRDRPGHFSFPLGEQRVIGGWDLGVEGLTVGTRARLTMPAALGYGESGAGDVIPAGATLVFDIELVAINE